MPDDSDDEALDELDDPDDESELVVRLADDDDLESVL